MVSYDHQNMLSHAKSCILSLNDSFHYQLLTSAARLIFNASLLGTLSPSLKHFSLNFCKMTVTYWKLKSLFYSTSPIHVSLLDQQPENIILFMSSEQIFHSIMQERACDYKILRYYPLPFIADLTSCLVW